MNCFIYGTEEYLKNKNIKKIAKGYEIHKTETFGEEEETLLSQISLFGSSTAIIYQPSTIKKGDTIIAFAEANKDSDNLLIISPKQVDKRTTEFTTLSKLCKVIDCKKFDDVSLAKFIKEIVELDERSLQTFMNISSYFEKDSVVDLYAINNMANLLRDYGDKITPEIVKSVCGDYSAAETFSLMKLYVNDSHDFIEEMNKVDPNMVIPTLGAMLREVRIAINSKDYGLEATGSRYSCLKGFSKNKLLKMFDVLQQASNDAKRGWTSEECLRYVGAKLVSIKESRKELVL